MVCSGLSSTLLLVMTCLLMNSGFIRAGPVAHSTGTTQRTIPCDRLNDYPLSCEIGVIMVQSAVYRCEDPAKCSQNGLLDAIKKRCDSKNVCDINKNMLGTPDPGNCKYLDTTYLCVSFHSVTCEGAQTNLQCDEGQVIVVHWANYGRRDKTTCSAGRPNSELQDVACSSPTSSEYLTKSCNGKNSCTITASNSVFGDPCYGTYKYLAVAYTCQNGSPKTCPPGWTSFEGRCFIFESSTKSWTDAEGFCKSHGGNLASFHSSAEYVFIRSLVYTATKSNQRSWVGGNDRQTEGEWKWTDGSQFDFTHWGNKEPNNYGGGEGCMEINFTGQDYVNDSKCENKQPFVCARDP